MMTDAGKVWDMAREFRSCMLVTQAGDDLRSRPMTPIVAPDENIVYFLARRAAKDDEIAEESAVNLAFTDGKSKQLSISGHARISSDVALKQRLWGLMSQAFLPEGPESSQTIAIVVTPTKAEYWEGDNAVSTAIAIGVGLARGREADVGDSAKVKM